MPYPTLVGTCRGMSAHHVLQLKMLRNADMPRHVPTEIMETNLEYRVAVGYAVGMDVIGMVRMNRDPLS